MEWTRPEVISAAALGVSGFSLTVSAFVAWRAFTADRPRLWLVLKPTEAPDCWIGNIHVQSGSRVGLAGHSARVAIISMASARNQSVLLGSYQGISTGDEHGNIRLASGYATQCNALKIPIHQEPTAAVQRGEHGVIPVLIYRPALSRSESVKLVVTLRTLSPRPSYRNYTIQSEFPGGGIGLVLGR